MDDSPLARSLEKARVAVAQAELGAKQPVDVEGDPRPLLSELIEEGALDRALLFLEREKPGRIRVHPRSATGQQTAGELLEEDHRRLDDIGEEMCKLAESDPRGARELAGVFVDGTERHLRIEDELLFPAYAAHGQSAIGALIAQMKREHQAMSHYLRRLLESAERLVHAVAGSVAAAVRDLQTSYNGLAWILADHNEREEGSLFPLLDRATAPEARTDMVRRIVLF